MLFSDLSLTLIIIMFNALVLNQSIVAKDIVVRDGTMFPSKFLLDHSGDFPDKGNFPANPTKNYSKFRRKLRKGNCKNWFLDPVIIKLATVISRYDFRNKTLGKIYTGISHCGLKRCGRLIQIIPDNQNLKNFNCSLRGGYLKRVTKFLNQFRLIVERIAKSLQAMINFEKQILSQEYFDVKEIKPRMKILNEFRREFEALNLEIETVMMNKRLRIDREIDGKVVDFFISPEAKSHLLLMEWRIFRESKKFLKDWQRNFRKIVKCWKNIRKEKKKKMEGSSSGEVKT